MGTFVSISGGGNANVHIYGNGSVVAGGGNDTISITGNGAITVGAGSDHLNLRGSGSIVQNNTLTKQGHDTINLGRGNDTISEAGRATVHGSFGSATIAGGKFEFLRVPDTSHNGNHHLIYEEMASSGSATLVGGEHCTQFVGGAGAVVMHGGRGDDTFVGGSGHATMTGGSGHNLFQFVGHENGGMDVITNFVCGHDKLYLEGKTLCYLQSHGDVTVSHGNTFISLDGGQTTVELKGFTNLTSHDVTTHKG
jgi:Ca2+-binding RTX toxin-like protein